MSQYKLFETKPAEKFSDAHFLGNGCLGFSVMGSVPREHIYINDDTLWSGSESFYENPQFYDKLLEARRLAMDGKVKEANTVVDEEMTGRWLEAYLPLASLHIMTGMADNRRTMSLKRIVEARPEQFKNYSRILDIDNAVETVEWSFQGIQYERKYFVSHPAGMGFVYCSVGAATPRSLNMAFDLDSQLRSIQGQTEEGCYVTGIAPDHSEPSYTPVTPSIIYGNETDSKALRFACVAEVIDTDGKVAADGQRVYVTDACYVLIAVQARTNYSGFRIERDNGIQALLERIQREIAIVRAARTASEQSGDKLREKKTAVSSLYEAVLEAHLTDYHELYDRVKIDLGTSFTGKMPTSERMTANAGSVEDPTLSALYIQYSRYLMIAGSRPGTQAMNLQGIWNDQLSAPWASNYTTNINVEMNYWPAEVLGLPECHLPLMDLLEETAQAGRQTAQVYYHEDGWVAHHNVDLWRGTEPSCEDASWAWWPFGGAWMCEHIWTHYEYTGDQAFLRKMYPVMREAARFLLQFLTVDEKGYLVTAPSISPENKYTTVTEPEIEKVSRLIATGLRGDSSRTDVSAVTVASTMDISILHELFRNVVSANEILQAGDDAFAADLKNAEKRLPPYRIGRYGQLQEWKEDYEECTPGFDHISHMYPVFPGNIINENTPELFKATQRSIERRQLHARHNEGWPAAWRICLEARFHNPLECGHLIKDIGAGFGAGLLTASGQQIDCILGLGAGIAEMLLQSHMEYIEILPAVPADWYMGSYSGIRARFEVGCAWNRGHILSGSVTAAVTDSSDSRTDHSETKRKCTIRAVGLRAAILQDGSRICGKDQISFNLKEGETAQLEFLPLDQYPVEYRLNTEQD